MRLQPVENNYSFITGIPELLGSFHRQLWKKRIGNLRHCENNYHE